PGNIQTNFLSNRESACAIGLPAATEQFLMKFQIFLAAIFILHAYRSRNLRCLDGSFAQNGEFLEHELEPVIGFKKLHHVVEGALAIAAIVIEKLNHGDIALRIAERNLPRGGEDRVVVLADRFAGFFSVCRSLTLLQLIHDVLQQLRMAEEIFLDDPLDFASLLNAKRLRLLGSQPYEAAGNDADAKQMKPMHIPCSLSHSRKKALFGGL